MGQQDHRHPELVREVRGSFEAPPLIRRRGGLACQVACGIKELIPHQPGYFCAYPEGRHLARRGIAVFHEALSTPPLNA